MQLEGDVVENRRVLSEVMMFQDDLLRVGAVIGATMAKGGIPRWMPSEEDVDGKFASHKLTYSSPMYTVQTLPECHAYLASCPRLLRCRDQMPDTLQSPSTKYQYRLSVTKGCYGTTSN